MKWKGVINVVGEVSDSEQLFALAQTIVNLETEILNRWRKISQKV